MRHSNLVLALFWAVASGLVLGTSRPDAGEVEPVSALSKRTPMFGGASSSGAGRSSTHQNEWIIRSFERYLPQGQQHMEAGQTYFFYTRVPWSSFLDYLRRDAPQPEAASAFLMSGFHYYVSQIEVSKKGSIAIKGQHRPLIAKETFWDVWTSEYMDKNHALRHATPTPVVGEHERMGLNKRPPRGGIWEHKIYYAFKVATPPGRELDKYLLAQSKQFRDAWVQIKRQHNREGQNSMPELYVKTILQAASKYTIDKIDHWPHSGTGRAAVGPLGHVGNTNPYTHDWPGLDDQRRLVRVGGTMKLEKFFRTGHA